jgi:hypothetical protein
MMTILESLKSISGYPVPDATILDVATRRGLNLEHESTPITLNSPAYSLAKADIFRWVSFAPNVDQGDVSYNMLYSDREQLRKQANAIYGELGDESYIIESKTKFGYKGNRL